MKLVGKTIRVEGTRYRIERLFVDDDVIQVFRRIDFWVVQSGWWSDEIRRIYLLLETDVGLLEVFTDGDGYWVLFRRLD